eukprot:scaffold60835_cov30-Cyclotella_meneghiniana.AAC.1
MLLLGSPSGPAMQISASSIMSKSNLDLAMLSLSSKASGGSPPTRPRGIQESLFTGESMKRIAP